MFLFKVDSYYRLIYMVIISTTMAQYYALSINLKKTSYLLIINIISIH